LDFSRKGALRGLLFPSGLVLLATVMLTESHWLSLPASAVAFYYYAVFGVGIDANLIAASLKAVVSAVNRSVAAEGRAAVSVSAGAAAAR